jgi:hypothetical protein
VQQFSQVAFMPRRKSLAKKPRKEYSDLSFPLPYQEQAKYLKLATDFMALDSYHPGDQVIPIDRNRRLQNGKSKKVA